MIWFVVFDRIIVGWLCLSIVVQEVVQIGHAFTEHFDARQIYHAEMVGLLPVEALDLVPAGSSFRAAIKSKLLVVSNIEFLCVNFREDVEAALGFYRGNTVDAVEGVVHVFTLFVYASAGNHIAFYAFGVPKALFERCFARERWSTGACSRAYRFPG